MTDGVQASKAITTAEGARANPSMDDRQVSRDHSFSSAGGDCSRDVALPPVASELLMMIDKP